MDPHEVCALHRKNRYDLILLDLQMPGMDGFQVMEGLKTNDADGYLPVLVITAQPGHKLRALQAGAQGFHQQAVRPGRSQDAHPQHAGSAPALQEARELQQGARADGAGAHRRAARKRGALSQPDRARLRLVLGAGRERQLHQGFRPGAGDARASGSTPLAGDAGAAPVDGWNEAERASLQATIAARQPFLDFVFSRVNADGSQQRFQVSGEPMFNQSCRFIGYRGIGVELGARDRRTRRCRHAHNPNQNHLLAALPDGGIRAPGRRIWSWSPLPLGEILYEPGGQLQHAYFPTTAIVSLHYVMESGASAEIAGVGNEGVVGISLFMGGNTTPSSAVVQTAGHAYRLEQPPAEGGIRPRRADAAPAAALHPGADHADVARPRSATGTTRWSSSCAAGCC